MASRSICEEHPAVKRTRHDDDVVDWISKLPDEILVKIVSLLSFSEALATSVLSSRWVHLWKSAVTVLDFDGFQLLDSEKPTMLPPVEESPPDSDDFIILDDGDDDEAAISPPVEVPRVVEIWRVYINWVNRVLSHLTNVPKVNKLRVNFNLKSKCNSEGDIDRWIEFAISKGVEHLDLSFGVMANTFFSPDLDYCIKTQTSLSNIKHLRSLRLSHVDVKDETVEHFIINCPLLEELALHNAYSLRELRIAGSPALKYLEVTSCQSLTSVTIDQAPSLIRIVYDGRWVGLSFLNCPSMVDVDMCFASTTELFDWLQLPGLAFDALSAYAGQLKSLSLDIDPSSMFPNMYELSSLEQLKIRVDQAKSDDSILGLVDPLINACPRLHTLRVELLDVQFNRDGCDYDDRVVEPVDDDVCRESIKVVEIVDFNGYDLERYSFPTTAIQTVASFSRRSRSESMASQSDCEEHRAAKRTRHNDDDEGEDDRVDWISKLPDELLIKILSLLSFSETLATSVLSSRWIHLWKSAVTVLDFDGFKLLDPGEPFLLPAEPSPDMDKWIFLDPSDVPEDAPPMKPPIVVQKRRVYVNWVTRVLNNLADVDKVNKLRVFFNLKSESNSQGDIDRWIEFAISKGVEHLDLCFGVLVNSYFTPDRDYCIKFPTGLSNIKHLRSLRLSHVDVKRKTIERLLISCPLLEELALNKAASLRNLRVAGSPALKYLEVTSCPRLSSMRIDNAPSLTRIVYRGLWAGVSFKNCPSLVDVEASFGHEWPDVAFHSLSPYAGQLESLSLEFDPWSIPFPEMFMDVFSSLKQLKIQIFEAKSDHSILRLVPLLNACPKLHTLRVELNVEYNPDGCDYEDRVIEPLGAVPCESIKVVEIFNYNGYDLDHEFVLYVFEYFTGLERIVISTEVWRAKYYKRDSELMANYVMNLVDAHVYASEFESVAPAGLEFVLV
ncbi:Putative F-box/LRR-repeat protein At5g25860 [Linum grandiflorum]